VDKDNTTLIDGAGKSSAIEGRIKQLRTQIEDTTVGLRPREAAGAAREAGRRRGDRQGGRRDRTAMKEKKARVEDALNATRAAVEEGIVPGGGVALLRAAQAIDGLKTLEGDEKVGAMIVKRALEAPIRQIVENAGLEGSVIVEKVKLLKSVNEGFDAETLAYVDMLKAGIIDPTKVTRVALPKRGVDRVAVAHHRGRDQRCSGRGEGRRAADAPRRRRHVLARQPESTRCGDGGAAPVGDPTGARLSPAET